MPEKLCIFAMAFVGYVSPLPHKVKDNLFLQTVEKLFDSRNKVRHQIMVEGWRGKNSMIYVLTDRLFSGNFKVLRASSRVLLLCSKKSYTPYWALHYHISWIVHA